MLPQKRRKMIFDRRSAVRTAFLLFALCLLPFNNVLAQNAAHEDFTLSSEARVNRLLDRGGLDETDRNYIVRSNFLLDRLLWSGQVQHDDPLSRYAARVADSLLVSEPELRKQIRIYTLRSSEVNAWTFGRGVILVTTGLYARLKSEAELAFILAHELSHYRKKHAFNTFALQSCADLQSCSAPVQLQRINVYSRDNELEADREGIELLRRTRYEMSVVPNVFDLLQYSYLPPEEVKFEKTFFEDSALVFPKQYYLGLLNDIVRRDEFNDSAGTHPSSRKRRIVTAHLLRDTVAVQRHLFLLGETPFTEMRKYAGKELCRLYLAEGAYREALYNAHAQLKNYPGDSLLRQTIAQSLYGIALVRSTYSRSEGAGYSLSSYANVQGQFQQVCYLVSRLGGVESAVLALHYNWKQHKREPQNKIYKAQCDSLLSLMTGLYRLERKDFYLVPPPPDRQQVDMGGDVRGEVVSPKPSYDFHRYALAGLLRDSAFTKRFRHYETRYQTTSFGDVILQHAPVRSILLLDPFVRVSEERDGAKEFFFAGAAKRRTLIGVTKRVAQEKGLQLRVLESDPSSGDPIPSEEIRLVNEWLGERIATGILFFPPAGTTPELARIPERYVLLTGIVYTDKFGSSELADPNPNSALFGKARSTCYALLYDLRTGQLLLNERLVKKSAPDEAQMKKWMEEILAKARKL